MSTRYQTPINFNVTYRDRHNKLIDLYGIFLLVLSTKITIFHIVENCHYNAYELLSKDYEVIALSRPQR
jgi:hypothetical protein